MCFPWDKQVSRNSLNRALAFWIGCGGPAILGVVRAISNPADKYAVIVASWDAVHDSFLEALMLVSERAESIPLPRGWPKRIRSSVIHAISLAHFSVTFARSVAANSINARIRLKAEINRLRQEIAILIEEARIKDSRMDRIPAQRRPHYPSIERMAILELRAARGWSLSQTARRFLVTPATIASWMQRLDDEGPDALVQVREPVNRFPDFVRYIVCRLKVLCPTMGKVKIAQILCRVGLHLSSTTESLGNLVTEELAA